MRCSVLEAIKRARRVYIIGNGGSYANAMHICNDLLLCGVKAFTLDPSTLTALANDFGYEVAYQMWIEKVGEKGDLLIALSGSGRSPNILNAIKAAEELGMEVWREFGAAKGLGMQDAEELQINLGHEVMKALRERG
jgi:D-sedoheptulose 7-phosphate isomerase